MTASPVDAAAVAEQGARGLVDIELVGFGSKPLPRLSVVVPAYREGPAITANIARLVEALEASALSWEVIVVVDGDRDTYFAALPSRGPRVQVHGYESNRGKGFALRYGISKARGELVTFIDSDMEIAPDEIGRMATLLQLYDADVVVGSKRHPLSEVQYPRLRRIQSIGYQLLVRMLFRVHVRDTQTGLKMMRRAVAMRVLDAAVVKRFAFDLELLALARHFGFRRIIEAPVRITYAFASTTNLRSVFWVLVDTLAIWYRLRLRRSYDRGTLGIAALLSALPATLGGD
jgi:glycosyltransferase involved in cell wall biosynthesis